MVIDRLGESQKSTLVVLLALERKGVTQIDMSKLLGIINNSRLNPVHKNNFRIGVKRLAEKGLINRRLTTSLTWAMALTQKGREKAQALEKMYN